MGKSAVNAYLRLNREVWSHLPPPVRTFPPIRLYGSFVNSLVRWRSARRQYFATYVLRNRPQLQLISRLSGQMAVGSTLRLAVLGCSNGAEVYSTLWTIRSRRPDLNVISHAVDISKDIVGRDHVAYRRRRVPGADSAPGASRYGDRQQLSLSHGTVTCRTMPADHRTSGQSRGIRCRVRNRSRRANPGCAGSGLETCP